MEKVYIVNWKETEIDSEGVLATECGTCDYAYLDEDAAIAKVADLADDKADECVSELGYPIEEVSVSKNDNGDAQTVECGSNSYKYWVLELPVIPN